MCAAAVAGRGDYATHILAALRTNNHISYELGELEVTHDPARGPDSSEKGDDREQLLRRLRNGTIAQSLSLNKHPC